MAARPNPCANLKPRILTALFVLRHQLPMVVQFPAKPWMVWRPSVLRSMTQQLPAVWMNLNAYPETQEMMATCVRLIQFVRSNVLMLKNNALKVMMVTIVKKKTIACRFQKTTRTNTV